MKTNKFSGNGASAIVTAALASLCCIAPVLAVLGGVGGIASSFDFLEPLRPYLIGLTVLTLGYAFYNAYRPKRPGATECACEEDGERKKFINSKAFLWIVAFVSLVLITFPYYSQALFPAEELSSVRSAGITKAEISIEGMSCTSCENSVNFALNSEDGVINAKSSFKTGIADVEFDKSKVSPETLKKAIEEKVGYKVKNIKIKEKNNAD